ncbi:MAG: lysophospholipid acyltransferase family protein [Halothiobacillaceae bacterium]
MPGTAASCAPDLSLPVAVPENDRVEDRFRVGFLHPRFWPTWLGAGLLWLLARAPNGIRLGLARLLATAYARLHPKRPQRVRENLLLCFPDLDQAAREAVCRRVLLLQAYALVDLGRQWFLPRARILDSIRVEGQEHLEAARAQGGVTLLTGHSAGLEWLAAFSSLHFQGSSIYKPFKGNPLLDWLFTRARTRFSGRVFLRRHGLRPHLRVLRQGGAFFYIADEDLGEANGAFVPFFGAPKKNTLALLGRIRQMSGQPVLPCFGRVEPEQGRYCLTFLPLCHDVPVDAAESARVTNRLLEQMIAPDPAQYMWQLKLFKTTDPDQEQGGPE